MGVGERLCECSDISKNLCDCEEGGIAVDWRASMAEIISASGSQLGTQEIGAPVEHGSKIEQIEGMLCRTYWEKETYEWGHILYELRLDMVTAHPVTWTVTDVYPEEKHLTRRVETRYLEFNQPVVVELPAVDTSLEDSLIQNAQEFISGILKKSADNVTRYFKPQYSQPQDKPAEFSDPRWGKGTLYSPLDTDQLEKSAGRRFWGG